MKQKQTGSGLIFSVVLLFVILGMVITLSSITVLETKMSQKTKSSIGAFYNSEAGVEWALNQISIKSGDAYISTIPSCPFGCNVLFLGADGKVLATSKKISDIKAVRSVGTQGGETQRAIEAAVAATGGGCYVSYIDDSTDGACITGFKNKGPTGVWGHCIQSTGSAPVLSYDHFKPPGGNCQAGWGSNNLGRAYVCCQS